MNTMTTVLSGIPTLWWGHPGIGKTAWLRGQADGLDLRVETLIGSMMDPTDIGGMPIRGESGTVTWSIPDWFARLRDAGRGILYLDELSCSPPSVQAAMLRLVAERSIHGHSLPPGVMIAASANPADCAAGGWDLTPPAANRWLHLDYEVNAVEWSRGLVHGWSSACSRELPDGWESGISSHRVIVAGYIRTHPARLVSMPESASDRGRAWPSPRTWDMVARVSAAAQSVREDDTLMVRGCVGESDAMQYLTYRRAMDLPDPVELIRDPNSWTPDKRDDRTIAVLSSLAPLVTDCASWDAAWEVVSRVVNHGQVDVAAAGARAIAARRPDGSVAPAIAARLMSVLSPDQKPAKKIKKI